MAPPSFHLSMPPSRDPLTGAMSVRAMTWEKNAGDRLEAPVPQ
jgi:hypothetical protein